MSMEANSDNPSVQGDGGDTRGAAVVRTPWWQWFFLYPVFGIALLSAIPEWADKYMEVTKNLGDRTAREAAMQQRLFQRNLECLQVPFYFVSVGNMKIDPVLCAATGDISLRYETSQGDTRVIFFNVGDRLTEVASRSFIGAAHAGPSEPAIELPSSHLPGAFQGLSLAQAAIPLVICVRQIDSRTVLRHVSEGGQCFDERIDMLTGWLTSRDPVSCRSSC